MSLQYKKKHHRVPLTNQLLLLNRKGRKAQERKTIKEKALDRTFTHNLFLVEVPRAVGGGEGGGAGLAVPRDIPVLCGAADGQGVDAVGVAVTVAAILLSPSVPRSPHKNGTQAPATLEEGEYIQKNRIAHPFAKQFTCSFVPLITEYKFHSLINRHPKANLWPVRAQHTSHLLVWSLSKFNRAK